ncbi:NAD-dependent epimerase/dehydratase family protein [Clostridium sp.]|uniref:NAD-dependent epimerase/dehydratase family protein n=1 Tax=Clostridium sp. TaxID=1506 RepID=UPI003F32B869
MSKFIVTGATGFVGSNLCKRLIYDNHEVHVICRENSNLSSLDDILDKVNIFRYGDDINTLIDYFKNIKADCVFHLASLFIAEHSSKDVSNLIDSNIKFSTEILEAMYLSNTKTIVNTGTSWQHFENDDYNPVCLYAATKQAFEAILTYYVNAYDFKAITLKLFDTYGETDKRNKLINNLKNIALNKTELNMSNGYQKIDLTHVEDVIIGFLHAFDLTRTGNFENNKSYAVCTGRTTTLRELIKVFEEVNNLKLNINWGARPYRFREVLIPWDNYTMLPEWKSTISLEEGVARIGKST